MFLNEFEREFSKRAGDLSNESVTQGILAVFAKIEADLKEQQGKKFKNEPKAAYVGACALMTLILNDRIFVANLGDCQGVLLGSLISQRHFGRDHLFQNQPQTQRQRQKGTAETRPRVPE